ncbi:hypothetical protein E4U16_001922 [Claviceps sp. LM84 group G4]|nr:hypothetical protein E4U33_001264 [Claviceps sp. LM78 group G4]KAG6077962.1 hypothetical protein E4U16_001922 [Claviceps sp. LM84 group G4]
MSRSFQQNAGHFFLPPMTSFLVFRGRSQAKAGTEDFKYVDVTNSFRCLIVGLVSPLWNAAASYERTLVVEVEAIVFAHCDDDYMTVQRHPSEHHLEDLKPFLASHRGQSSASTDISSFLAPEQSSRKHLV